MQSIKPAVPVLSRILAQLQRGEVQIPAVPTVVMELRELVPRSDSKLEAIVALIERDPALVARVLQLGRSASVGQSVPPQDLRYIISRVGLRQLGDMVETVWANDCFKIADSRYTSYMARISRHSLARAVAMRALADTLQLDAFPAYLSGLFADVGAAFLLWAIVDKSRGHAPEPADALAFVRAHHEVMSGAVLKRWGHTELVTNLVRRHHAPALLGSSTVHGSLLVVASQMAAELTGDEDVTVDAPWPPSELLERCVSHAGLTDSARTRIIDRLKEGYSSTLDALKPAAH